MGSAFPNGRIAFALFGILTGLLSVLLVASSSLPAPKLPSEVLPFFESHRLSYLIMAVTVLVWLVVAIPFIVGLGDYLAPASRSLSRVAVALSAGGACMFAFATFAYTGAFLAIVASSDAAPSVAEVTFQAAIWANLSFFLSDPGLMALGAGQFLFALSAWKSGSLPGYVSLTGLIGGLAGLLTLAVYQTSLLALIQIAAFGVWGIAVGVVFLRRKEVVFP